MPTEEPKWKVNQRASIKEYRKITYKRIPLDVRKDYYDEVLMPASKKVGEPMNTFIQKAINERLKRENLYPAGYFDVSEELQKPIDDALSYILQVKDSFGSRPDRIKQWESKLETYIKYYLRDAYKLSKHDEEKSIAQVIKLYKESKGD